VKIALFGYGKMGRMIEQVALQRGHIIAAKVDIDAGEIDFSAIDVAIDFSAPDAAFENIKSCFEHGVPVISGTTGWLEKYEAAVRLCNENNTGFIYASNFSLGVNVFFELNSYLAEMMKNLKEYEVSITEIHHIQKLDAPSGTAITLAEGVIAQTHNNGWVLNKREKNKIRITSLREGEVPGTHTVAYASEIDTITIEHIANNRQGFALGAVIAAEWIIGKKGVFSMRDVLNLG
jgi:4-hydroxy-tetrahydrodipicolinate reductase